MRHVQFQSMAAFLILAGAVGCGTSGASVDGAARSITGTVSQEFRGLDNPVVIATSGTTRFVASVQRNGTFGVDVRTGDSYRLLLANSRSDGSYEIVSRIPWGDDANAVGWARVEDGATIDLGTLTPVGDGTMAVRSHGEHEGTESGDDDGGRGEAEPGDDKGGRGENEAGDDKGGRGEAEPGDDKGGRGENEAGDDRGGHGENEAGDDKGGHGENEAGDDKGGRRTRTCSDDSGSDDSRGRKKDRANCEDASIRTCSAAGKTERVRTRCIGHGQKVIVGVRQDDDADRSHEARIGAVACGGSTSAAPVLAGGSAADGASCLTNSECASGACFANACAARVVNSLR
ncbi:MAG: hypothetical protein U0169_12225 [Polyangiaceae bacterium]